MRRVDSTQHVVCMTVGEGELYAQVHYWLALSYMGIDTK